MLNNFERIKILSDALPFIQRFKGCTIVIKYGGSTMKNIPLKSKIVKDILLLSYIGIKVVIVHGGGPMINYWLKQVNIQPKFVNGIRVTDKKTMELVEMVLAGKVNKDLVTLLNCSSNIAVGLSCKDANLIVASSFFPDQQDNYTGQVYKVNIEIINFLLNSGYIPVIASVASDENGHTYNINADSIAGAIAESLSAEKLILLTDTPGIMLDMSNPSSLVKHLNIKDLEDLKSQKIISGGMIPKVDCCIKALQNSVGAAHIINGNIEHALLLEILTSGGIGSMLVL
uniref:Acetylglutamate kinase n=1 Tax=Gracilaria vermiculophylla TaxID=2608709 RepID=A0A345U967_9FLOR|nr:acetylglutamate kinase [Gracilaria vermiculophylla]AXI97003.1 acetylglutamate kinase [Gracilaria vermiculophylla]QXU75207.1 acetylglutamate kinase [Gracilaria vermiculophylla]WDZ67928.1 acetylglutamate kinase [Gracilaria vermiculophylla]